MARSIATGIDIGTHHVRVVIGERIKKGDQIRKHILGVGIARSRGLRHGYVINANEAIHSLTQALRHAEEMAGVRIKRAYLSVGGVSLEGVLGTGSSVISRADSEITELDVEHAVKAAEESLPKNATQNRTILHTVPLVYKIDGKEILGRPTGMKGLKLESKVFLITSLTQHLDDLVRVVEETGIEVEDIIAAPLAAGLVNLNKTQKIAGVLLANIGAETVSVVVYEDNIPISLKVFPIGSTAITNDIALGLKIPLEEAEDVKLQGPKSEKHSQKQLDEIIEARLTDILELIEAHLKKIKKSGLLPAGIVITGGGSGIATIDDLAKAALKLPSRVAELSIASTKGVIRDPSWSVAYGLCMLGLTGAHDEQPGFTVSAHSAKDTIFSWVRKFLP